MYESLAIITFNPFSWELTILSVILVVLLSCSAMISGSETAMFSLSPTDIKTIKNKRTKSDQAVLKLLSEQDYFLATILILNNLVNICIILISNRVLDTWMVIGGSVIWAFVIKVIIVTFLLLLFGEIVPKIYAAYNTLGFARVIAVPMLSLKRLMRPAAYVLIKSGNFASRSISNKQGISIDELSNAIEITKNQSAEERQMLSGIVSFVNTDVEQIMKHRIDMVVLDITDDYEHVKRVIIESGFSRIPAYEDSVDNIKGVLYVKDLLVHLHEKSDFNWHSLLRKPYFVHQDKKINDLLQEFRDSKVHIAIVVDEYGSTIGLVSLEDILEEIVGEISDESDKDASHGYEKIDDNTYIFDGKIHINELIKVLNLGDIYFDEVRGEAETIAGLMLEIKRDFLKVNETLHIKNLTMKVKSIEGRRIDRVEVIRKGK